MTELKSDRPVLFVPHNAHAVDTLIPVAEEMVRRGYRPVIYTSASLGLEARIRQKHSKVPFDAPDMGSSFPFHQYLARLLGNRFGCPWLNRAMLQDARRVIDIFTPRVLVTTHDVQVEQAWLIRAAALSKTPAVVVQPFFELPATYYYELRGRLRPWLFTLSQIDLDSFIECLVDEAEGDSPYARVWELLSDRTKSLILRTTHSGNHGNRVRNVLLREMNRILLNTIIYQEASLEQVDGPHSRLLTGESLVAANRMWMDRRFSTYIRETPVSYEADRGQNHPRSQGGAVNSLADVLGKVADRVNGWKAPRLRNRSTFGGGEADRVAVMGRAFIEQYAAQGADRRALNATGHPEHDRIHKRVSRQCRTSYAAKNRVVSELGLTDGPLFVYASQPHAQSNIAMMTVATQQEDTRAVVESVLEIEDAVLVIKIHPKEELGDYRFTQEYGSRVKVYKDQDLVSLVEACDVFISQFSSTILLAYGFRTPVVTFNFTNTVSASYFEEIGGSLHVRKQTDLKRALGDALLDHGARERMAVEQQEVVSRYMVLDGMAVERIANLIEQELAASDGKS